MLNWLKRRRLAKLEKSGGLEEKKHAIAKTNETAEYVIKKMRSLGADRRYENVPINGPERRTA